MKKARKTDPFLTPAQAAAVIGMSRPGFLGHVGKGIHPDRMSRANGRMLFRLSNVLAFRVARTAAGAKKRGPKRGNGRKRVRT